MQKTILWAVGIFSFAMVLSTWIYCGYNQFKIQTVGVAGAFLLDKRTGEMWFLGGPEKIPVKEKKIALRDNSKTVSPPQLSKLAEFKKKYPAYKNMSDADLARALHRKFYSDMPFDQFAAKIGLDGPDSISATTTRNKVNPKK